MCETECESTSLSDDYTAPTVIHSQFVHLLGKLGLYELTRAGPGLSARATRRSPHRPIIVAMFEWKRYMHSTPQQVTCTAPQKVYTLNTLISEWLREQQHFCIASCRARPSSNDRYTNEKREAGRVIKSGTSRVSRGILLTSRRNMCLSLDVITCLE